MSPQRQPLIGKNLEELAGITAEMAMPRFAAAQIADWLYVKRVSDIEQMTNLSKQARKRLAEEYCVGLMPPLMKAESTDGTIKYLFEGCGRRDIEAVYIPDRERAPCA